MSTNEAGPVKPHPVSRLKTEYSVTLFVNGRFEALKKNISATLKSQEMMIEPEQITSLEIRYIKDENRVDGIFGELVLKVQRLKLSKNTEDSLCDAICKARGDLLHG